MEGAVRMEGGVGGKGEEMLAFFFFNLEGRWAPFSHKHNLFLLRATYQWTLAGHFVGLGV